MYSGNQAYGAKQPNECPKSKSLRTDLEYLFADV